MRRVPSSTRARSIARRDRSRRRPPRATCRLGHEGARGARSHPRPRRAPRRRGAAVHRPRGRQRHPQGARQRRRQRRAQRRARTPTSCSSVACFADEGPTLRRFPPACPRPGQPDPQAHLPHHRDRRPMSDERLEIVQGPPPGRRPSPGRRRGPPPRPRRAQPCPCRGLQVLRRRRAETEAPAPTIDGCSGLPSRGRPSTGRGDRRDEAPADEAGPQSARRADEADTATPAR